MNAGARIAGATALAAQGLDRLAPVGDLAIRLWVANVFWKAGLTKIASWDTTVLLFTHEYRVPLLAPEPAALLATAIELVFPVLLALGRAGRLSALALFAFNAVAVVSYPGLSHVGMRDHTVWGLMLLVPLLHGPGRLSLDALIARRRRVPLALAQPVHQAVNAGREQQ